MELRRLYPEPGALTTEQATSGLRLAELAQPERPYLVLNMVTTLDGRIAIGGRSGQIGNDADRELFHGLRTQVDAVMVGAGTVRAERYGRMVRSPERRERREREGLDPDPLAVVVSARLNLSPDLPLLQDPHQRILVITASDARLPETPARVDYLHAPLTNGAISLAEPMRRLRAEHGVRSVLCEGGAALNEGLIGEGVVDELFLSLAPKLAGGDPLTILLGPQLDPPRELTLVWALEQGGHLFLRYRMDR